ncbi:MAG: hypothetical protein A2474_02505 [Elusimicrobia bacterium RIFOXYC2_FULL_34_12]|nr:MAG: hypothetical protein A2474_02505 [Elusimicrobia bacterium RIFOXYC2_FULL_34_12]OGS39010.1 MAG: hypothetical protein A2551_07240 [Elusimicrobia bacterium RIFOXYD2_FULL_34_30]HAM39671.1 hypothetical protein [Elusimicrobiota bacterium]
MICPSCGNVSEQNDKYCNRCGLVVSVKTQKLFDSVGTLSWIMRRALGGMFAGIIGWILSIALSRTIGSSSSMIVHLVVGGAIGGAFLGNVGGIIEHSSYKAFLGGILGCIGGILGGLINRPLYDYFSAHTMAYSISHSFSWSIAGLFIGATSGLIEKNINKVIVGVVAGFIGGAIGGGLGSGLYVSLVLDISRPNWITARFVEAIAGAVVGMNLWFVLGLVEKIYIFDRKQLRDETEKICDFCNAHNSLKAWYCKNCGKALQVSASVEKLKITPYRSLERIANAFKFISWLSAVAGVVLVIIIFIFLLFKNPFFAVFVSIALAILVYIISVLLNGTSEVITKFIKLRELE